MENVISHYTLIDAIIGQEMWIISNNTLPNSINKIQIHSN